MPIITLDYDEILTIVRQLEEEKWAKRENKLIVK